MVQSILILALIAVAIHYFFFNSNSIVNQLRVGLITFEDIQKIINQSQLHYGEAPDANEAQKSYCFKNNGVSIHYYVSKFTEPDLRLVETFDILPTGENDRVNGLMVTSINGEIIQVSNNEGIDIPSFLNQRSEFKSFYETFKKEVEHLL